MNEVTGEKKRNENWNVREWGKVNILQESNSFEKRMAANNKNARTPILKLSENVKSEDFSISAKCWFWDYLLLEVCFLIFGGVL